MNNAAQLGQINNINQLFSRFTSIGSAVIYLLVSLAVVYIVWSVVQYLIKGKEGDESRHAALMQVMWGIVGLAIIVSIWGIVNILLRTFWTNTRKPDLPNADFVNRPGTAGYTDVAPNINGSGGYYITR